MKAFLQILPRVGRMLLLVCLALTATVALVRFAPGYMTDTREADVRYAAGARSELQAMQTAQGSFLATVQTSLLGWLHGDMGQSRQFDVPVAQLIKPRLGVTAALLARGVGLGWLLALATALPVSVLRAGSTLASLPFTLLLAVPTGAMATFCLVSAWGGPVLVLTLLLAARDFKFLERALRVAWASPHVLNARAQGLRSSQIVLTHVLPNVWPQMLALATVSLVTALSALVPVEVIFDQPGIGQLAWTAAMNRDLPVLLATTLVMACAVAVTGMRVNRKVEAWR